MGRFKASKKLLAYALTIVFILSLVPNLGGIARAEETHASDITANAVWSDGDTVETLTVIGGESADAPLTITVKGTVTVNGMITAASGYVTFTGGGTLLRGTEYNDQLLTVSGTATGTLDGIILDGNKAVNTTTTQPLVEINDNTILHMNDGSSLQNNKSIYASYETSYFGGAVRITNGTFVMNGGNITGNQTVGTSNRGAGIYILANGTFTMNGGIINDNISASWSGGVYIADGTCNIYDGIIKDNTASMRAHNMGGMGANGKFVMRGGSILGGGTTANPSLFFNGTLCNIIPEKNIVIEGVTSFNSSAPVMITPAQGYAIASVYVDGVSKNSEENGSYILAPASTTTFETGITVTLADSGGTNPDDDPPPTNGQYVDGELAVNYFANYGGTVTVDEFGEFTITATKTGYVIDTICIDGVPLLDANNPIGKASDTYTFATDAAGTHSIVATFAYILSFNSPANGTLSVSRGGVTLTSGSIVRGGEVLTITVVGNSDAYTLESLNLTGIRDNEDGTYTVSAKNGDNTPAIDATMRTVNTAETPEFSPVAGVVELNATVAITSATSGASIYFTTDGSTPDTSSTLYTTPVAITNDMTLKAIAAKADFLNSDVATAAYSLQQYTITVEVNDTGTITPSAPTAKEGAVVTIDSSPNYGYALVSLSYHTGNPANSTPIVDGQFTMPCSNVTIVATYKTRQIITEIKTADDLVAFSALVNGDDGGEPVNYQGMTVTLANSVNLQGIEWTPIGKNSITPFSGIFDGGGFTISNMSLEYAYDSAITPYTSPYYSNPCFALFGAAVGANISNLTVTGTITIADEYTEYTDVGKQPTFYAAPYVGGILGFGNSSTAISDCVSRVNITATSATVGGIVGFARGSEVSDCINYGNILINKHNVNAGGIIGFVQNESPLSRCANYGNITVNGIQTLGVDSSVQPKWYDVAYGYAGGLVGFTNGNITESVNKGSVVGWAKNIGGLAGGAQNASITITDTYNVGALHLNVDHKNSQLTKTYVAGLIGEVGDGSILDLSRCYNIGEVRSDVTDAGLRQIATKYILGESQNWPPTIATVNESNCYGADETADITLENLGDKFIGDPEGINSSFPLLHWEDASASDTEYKVTFAVTPVGASLTLYKANEPVTPTEPGVYSLKSGGYTYSVSMPGYRTVESSITVAQSNQTFNVDLRAVTEVIFQVTPTNAGFVLKDADGKTITPDESGSGSYKYTLLSGDAYTYTATRDGFNGTTREYVIAGTETVKIELTPSAQVGSNTTLAGNETIPEPGTYNLDKSATGMLTINKPGSYTLVGSGISEESINENLYIKCTVSGVSITLRDVYIQNTVGTANMIDFTGQGNYLYFQGTSILDMNTGATGYAMVHVNHNTSLTVSGVSDSDSLYFYKREQGAGIGGNGGADGGEGQTAETNGAITIERGNLFMKNSKQGALIGAGAQAGTQKPGAITINGGILNLVAISRGSAIGGSAGSGGASSGTDVYMNGGTVTINIDWSGAAIGGGGYDGGNDSDGGTFYYSGGSIRTYINVNAVGQWSSFGVAEHGVDDVAITAKKVNEDGTKPVYMLVLNTKSISGSNFRVTVDGNNIYSGGLHQSSYVNESLQKSQQLDIKYTIDNWTSLNDSNLYLYLTGESHSLVINGKTFNVTWDDDAKEFTIKDEAGNVISADNGGTPTTPKPEVIITPEVVADSNGKATANVTENEISDAIESAQSQKVGTIVIAPEITGNVSNVTVTLPAKSAQDLVDAKIVILIQTDLGEITLSTEALKEVIVGAGSNSTLSIAIDTDALGTTKIILSIGGKNIDNLGRAIRIKLPVPDSLMVPLAPLPGLSGTISPHLVVYLNGANGNKLIQKSLVINNTAYFLLNGTAEVTIAENRITFNDVQATDWFYNEASFAASHELFRGVSENEVAPNTPMTRAMLVTVLYRLETEPDVSIGELFGDVDTGLWYTEAVAWAAENGIVDGIGDNEFNPNGDVTREQLATILYRYAKHLGMDTSATADLSVYTDGGKTSSWAADAMKWAVGSGIITGTSTTTVDLQGAATRAQVATMLTRMIAIMVR